MTAQEFVVRLEQLVYLDAIVRHGSLRKAAAQLGISQPSLSQQIQRLEEDLGVLLLVRKPTGVTATAALEVLLPRVRLVLRAVDALDQEAGEIAGARRGDVRLGSIAAASRALLPGVVRRFQSSHPTIGFQVVEDGSNAIRASVVAGDLDLGLVSRIVRKDAELADQLEIEDIAEGYLNLCVPMSDPISRQDRATPSQLTDRRWIVFHKGYLLRDVYDKVLRHTGQPVFFTSSSETARNLVAEGAGITILSRLDSFGNPHRVTDSRIKFVPLVDAWSETRLSMVRRRGEQPPPAVRALQALIREEASRLRRRLSGSS